MKTPQTLLRQLLKQGRDLLPEGLTGDGSGNSSGTQEYSIDELARVAGTTVRNVRAYQDRGLLPPPERRGRAGIYRQGHLSRLNVINQLLERGYTIANIKELVEAWESGQDLDHVLGLDSVLAGTWTEEMPVYMEADEVAALFGSDINEDVLRKALEVGLFEVDGDRLRIPSPRLLNAGLELYNAGVPLSVLLRELEIVRADVDRLTRSFVQLVVNHVVEPLTVDQMPSPEEVARLGEIIQRLRPLAESVTNAEMAKGIRKHANAFLGAKFRELIKRYDADALRKVAGLTGKPGN
jgi:DNA-binding transcriptional MerR regulator